MHKMYDSLISSCYASSNEAAGVCVWESFMHIFIVLSMTVTVCNGREFYRTRIQTHNMVKINPFDGT